MYKQKEVVRRAAALVAAAGLFAGIGSSILPQLALADALNPLTERTLLLSSSAPGYVSTDGSGNAKYAPPNSGANGQKTGETFTFKVSTDSSGGTPKVEAFTFQYCTTAAGKCAAPGNGTGSSESNLNVTIGNGTTTTAPSEVSAIPSNSGSFPGTVNPDSSQGTFAVEYSTNSGSTWTLDTGWAMATSNLEDATSGTTGADNFITLTKSAGLTAEPAGTEIKVQFFGTNDNYITNPGAGAFFVKINDYSDSTYQNFDQDYPTSGHAPDVIDGGVTVANVMNDSIEIQTKVLETMEFSVGNTDPDTGTGAHAQCDAVTEGGNGNTITLGNTDAENSLDVGKPYDAWSFWRLSSNSSNGATVYYSGDTLANTENNKIGEVYNLGGSNQPGDNSSAASHPGSEQFGLGIDVTDPGSNQVFVDNYNDSNSGSSAVTNGGSEHSPVLDSSFTGDVTTNNPTSDKDNNWHNPQLYPLVPASGYGSANGSIGTADAGAQFAFSKTANTIPQPIASESTQVVNCSTGLMRYIGNIAATTPAGIYTTKINYLAAPEY